MLASMRGAASKSEMKPNMHTGFFHWGETVMWKCAMWEGLVSASSTLVLILETATRELIRYLSGSDVSTTSGLPFPQADLHP